ncbi:MAG: peptidylprolyl isomerase [Thermoanaerobaculia bacterium]|jgi:peptidyl-prolyl cis-trans isomerase A (cyclophilin A)|nr:peptidylprolyl isomerase [Thermoanaerobaculia bacterium]MBP9824603.1 peptidylprolyl isomerase [Thermoanaerobaculia bacterium]
MRHPAPALALRSLLLLACLGSPLVAQASPPAPAPESAAPVVVRLETELGAIDLEIDLVRAPLSAANFLRYVDAGRYDGGRFHRTVRPDTETRPDVPIAVVQAGVAPLRQTEDFPPVPLERTRDTGLRHLAGTLSMARGTPDSATSDFFVCLEDSPVLDFGGARNPDGQGFAAFGRVTSGLDVVRKIQASPATDQSLTPPVAIVRAFRRP